MAEPASQRAARASQIASEAADRELIGKPDANHSGCAFRCGPPVIAIKPLQKEAPPLPK
jgi:hypothetical protein